MLNLFKSSPLLEAQSAQWIFDCYAWAFNHFDSDEFFNRSRLIQPSNEFFPGRVDSVHAKAENIFQHSLNYSGLGHWPFKLQSPQEFQQPQLPPQVDSDLARNSEQALPVVSASAELCISYNPQQTLKPEDLSSSFAHSFAQLLAIQSQQLPPGGGEYFAEATELLAIFMGFGVMFANSAYTFRGGCGSCYNAQANRQATLAEDEVIFALALYCRLKSIPSSEATRHLKKHLKSAFKKAVKQIDSEPQQLQRLFKFQSSAATPAT